MDPSRYEVNQQVRTVLTQHGVNLSTVNYSYIGGTVYLTGSIQKVSSDEFTPTGMDELARDISRLHGVRDLQFDLDNWSLVHGRGTWVITPRKFRPAPVSLTIPHEEGIISTDATIEIKEEEKITDVLKDIKKQKEPDAENK